MSLDMINREVGVANKIFLGNAPRQNRYSTKIQIISRYERMYVCTTEPYYPWGKKVKIVIIIIYEKYIIRRVQNNVAKIVWEFVIVC